MATINITGAAARLLTYGPLAKAGYCLYYVFHAISGGGVNYLTGGSDTAYHTWLATPVNRRHYERNVPKDMPAYLGPRLLSSAGDVIISRGDGTFAATDWPGWKQVGICTLAEREAQTGRKFVGWADSMGGYDLTTINPADNTATASAGAAIAIPTPVYEGEEMSTIYFKGDKSGAVFALNKDTGKKRNVTSSEFAIVNSASTGQLPNFGSVSGGGLVIVPQAAADAIPTA